MAQHPPALFVAESRGLDFLNSIATPAGKEFDWIDSGDGLLAWLEQADLVPSDALETLRGQAMPGELDRVAAQARSLREWFRTFVRDRRGRPLTADDLQDLEPLNRLLDRDEGYGQIVARDSAEDTGLELRMMRRWRSPESLLLPIGAALAKFVCEEDFSNVKACEGPACRLMFVDHTRGRARRWCSMAMCGNRAKQAAHRNRRRTQRTPG
ncbi:CGNR zinc finger domain-containing protein [Saccharopolyspora sp. 5N708]|uniref:CGNR zinc finger domain-containing protein n=1 Tax=Saccharopolyspora sp. 5N708 TaxID=3457424 RepID=UPI003FD2561D